MRIKSLYVAGFLALLLGGCKGSADAYENGLEEGAMQVCFEVKDISEDVYEELKSRRYC